METNDSEAIVHKIESVGGKKNCCDQLKSLSIFTERDKIFIDKDTGYVSKFGVLSTLVLALFLGWIIFWSFSQINSVLDCCNVAQE